MRSLLPIPALLPSLLFAAPPVYQSDFARDHSGFTVQWNPEGKLTSATDDTVHCPSGAPTLRTDATANARGSVGVGIRVGQARTWRIRFWARGKLTQGHASVNLQCWSADNRQVAWLGVSGVPTSGQLREVVSVVQIPDDCDHLNLLILHENAVGSTWIGDVVIDELAVRLLPPKQPTRWSTTGYFNGYDDRAQDTALKLFAAAGITTTRGWINWSSSEPERGIYDFSALDRQLSLVAQYGCTVSIVCIHGTPEWASGKTWEKDLPQDKRDKPWLAKRAFFPPTEWDDWRRYVEALVGHFRGRVAAWEIMNEPDLWSEGFCGSYEDYCRYLQIAHETAHRIDPQCRVFVAAMVFGEWLPRLLAEGMGKYFDGVCIHPYGQHPAECLARADRTRLLLAAADLERDVWVTEVGFQSGGWKEGPGHLDSETQKADYGRKALAGLSERCELVTWYHGIEAGNMYGLLRQDDDRYVPMPIYYEYGDLTGRLRKAGGPIRVEVQVPAQVRKGEASRIVLLATNTTAGALSAKLWPVGFVTSLGPVGGPREHDWQGTLRSGETRRIEVTVTPLQAAKDKYLVGLAAITDAGNTLGLQPLVMAE